MNADNNSRYVALAEYNGQAVPLKCDANGYLLVNLQTTGTTSATPSAQSVGGNSREAATAENSGATLILQSDSDGNLYMVT